MTNKNVGFFFLYRGIGNDSQVDFHDYEISSFTFSVNFIVLMRCLTNCIEYSSSFCFLFFN